jgi:hypothetical protein
LAKNARFLTIQTQSIVPFSRTLNLGKSWLRMNHMLAAAGSAHWNWK